MRVIQLITALVVVVLVSCSEDPIDPEVAAYFDDMERYCVAQDAANQGTLYAEQFHLTFIEPDGTTTREQNTREEYVRYVESFLASVEDYQYGHDVQQIEKRPDGTVYAKIRVSQSYRLNGRSQRYTAIEELVLQHVEGRYEALKMRVTYQ